MTCNFMNGDSTFVVESSDKSIVEASVKSIDKTRTSPEPDIDKIIPESEYNADWMLYFKAVGIGKAALIVRDDSGHSLRKTSPLYAITGHAQHHESSMPIQKAF